MKKSRQLGSALLAVTLLIVSACSGGMPGQSAEKRDPDKPHVVVIGSEIEGIYLARAAKDEGLSVLILDPRDEPGGQLIQGEMQYLDEPFDAAAKSLLQGRVKELFDRYKKGEIRKAGEFRQYFDTLVKDIPLESGITLTRVNRVQDAKTSKQVIESIAYRTKDGAEKTVTPGYVVENTDYAAVAGGLGLERIPGIETVFGGPKNYMAASIMMKFRGIDWEKFQTEVNKLTPAEMEAKYGGSTHVTDKFTWGFGKVGARYKPSRPEVFLRGLNTIHQRDGEVLINALLVYNVDPASPESVQQALEMGRTETERILPHLRQELPGWEQAEINGYPGYLYIRDYNRYETEYVLQASDMMSGEMFWDNVAIAGYPIDLQGIMTRTWGQHTGTPDKYGMPLRSFIPQGYSNVIFAGKNVGASAVAYGSARIQPNTSLAAEVIGIMLGRLKGERGLAELTEEEMQKLQAYVQKKYKIALTGVPSENKIKDLSEEKIRQLDAGKLTLP